MRASVRAFVGDSTITRSPEPAASAGAFRFRGAFSFAGAGAGTASSPAISTVCSTVIVLPLAGPRQTKGAPLGALLYFKIQTLASGVRYKLARTRAGAAAHARERATFGRAEGAYKPVGPARSDPNGPPRGAPAVPPARGGRRSP